MPRDRANPPTHTEPHPGGIVMQCGRCLVVHALDGPCSHIDTGTLQHIIDTALDDLRRDGKGWDPVAFGARFGIDPEDATALRRFGEHERAAILRWLYRKST